MVTSAIRRADPANNRPSRQPPPQPSPAGGGGSPTHGADSALPRRRGTVGVGATVGSTASVSPRLHRQCADRGAARGPRLAQIPPADGRVLVPPPRPPPPH